MTIYIHTNIHGQSQKDIVTEFDSKSSFLDYVQEYNQQASLYESIDDLCEYLADNGFGHGARSHYRVTQKEAKELIKGGAQDDTWICR